MYVQFIQHLIMQYLQTSEFFPIYDFISIATEIFITRSYYVYLNGYWKK